MRRACRALSRRATAYIAAAADVAGVIAAYARVIEVRRQARVLRAASTNDGVMRHDDAVRDARRYARRAVL